MAEISNTYQNDVGFVQNGTGMYIKDTATFKFYDLDVTGLQLRNMIGNIINGEKDVHQSGTKLADSCKITVSNYTYYKISLASNGTAWSFYLASCSAGQEVYIRTVQGSAAGSCNVHLLTSVGTSIAFYSCGLDSLILSDTAGSAPFVHLRCFADNQWTVLDTRGIVA